MTSQPPTRQTPGVPSDAAALATTLRSLVGSRLKLSYLRDYVGAGQDHDVARNLDALCGAAARGEEAAREPVLVIAMFLAGLGEDPIADRLGTTAAMLGLEHLGRLLRRAPELVPVEEPTRIPDYGAGRELSLGERKALARAPRRTQFEKLLRDPHPAVIARLLENPLLTEADVVRLAALRPAHPGALRVLARTDWLCRARVRMAIIQNPGTPSAVAVPLIAACTRRELEAVCGCMDCSSLVRETAQALLATRREANAGA